MSEDIKTLWILCWLIWWTWWDLRYRVIHLWQVILMLAAGTLWQLVEGVLFDADIMIGVLLGAAACGFSVATRDRFGMGDAMVILCLGLYHGGSIALAVWLWGLLIASAISIYLLARKKCTSQHSLPLIPCLTAGYVLMWSSRLVDVWGGGV